jgi:hypothetical protein
MSKFYSKYLINLKFKNKLNEVDEAVKSFALRWCGVPNQANAIFHIWSFQFFDKNYLNAYYVVQKNV